MTRERRRVGDRARDRGQAFTLEGVLGATFMVIALLIALQTTVITPTTGGAVDDDTRTQLQQKGIDVLTITANEEPVDGQSVKDLSWYVRFWNPNTRTFHGAERPEIGYGVGGVPERYGPDDLHLGELLSETFTDSGRRYNLILRYRLNATSSEAGVQRMVYMGPPAQHAVVATHTVTLFDNETLARPAGEGTGRELWEYDTNASDNDDSYYPIPDVVDGPVYNVVEVRLVIW